MDSLATCCLLASIYFLMRKKGWLSFGTLALSFLSKIYTIFLFPFLVQRSWRWTPLLFFFLLIFCISFPYYFEAHENLFSGLTIYSIHWSFNHSLYGALEWVFTITRLQNLSSAFLEPLGLTKVFIALLTMGVLLMVLVKKKETSLLKICFWSIGLLLLCSPTFHFWYLTWMVPFLVFFPNRAWILLTGTIMVSQEVLIGYASVGVWEEKWWVKGVEFIPFYLLLAYDYLKHRFPTTNKNPSLFFYLAIFSCTTVYLKV